MEKSTVQAFELQKREAEAREERLKEKGEAEASAAPSTEESAEPAEGEEHVHGPDCEHGHAAPFRREAPKVGRNDPCHCGSGKKFKKCHGA